MNQQDSIAIIGGGVIGLSIGWHLTQLGLRPYIFEKKTVGHEASLAAAGMITPASEVRFGEETLLHLFLESLKTYPSFIQSVQKTAQMNVDFHQTGSLMIAIDQDDEAELQRFYEYQKELGLHVSLLTPQQVKEKEPLLSHQCIAAINAPDECFLDNRLLVEALKIAFMKGGGKLVEQQEVKNIDIQNNTVQSITIGEEKLKVSHVILATGIHTDLPGLPNNLLLPIRPIKGQALDLKLGNQLPLQHAVRTIHRYPVYIVPRADGRLTIGASNEEKGLDQQLTAGAILDLLYGAWKILPAVYDMEFVETWVGHRAASRDHSPIIGPTDVTGLHLAMGMYRHGFLLTPLIGKIMAEWVAKNTHSKYLDKFSYKRFLG